ncbi:cytochrome p450 protein [Apiospora hydei]|uniref:Cytochrome p450 protein n=1 Tax=Apiospora hydei TaxID=1337664 RepID=A0ABR1V662_9PEZI
MGDLFVLVTPQYNMVKLNDPEAIVNVFKRSHNFPRPVWVNDVLGVFGPNISCAEGHSWRTQRRVATRCFNEANNEIVWSEALGLAEGMLRYWSSNTSVKSSAEDIRTLTLNGKAEQRPTGKGRSLSYRESLALILENLILILAVGPKNLATLSRYWLPSKLRQVNQAVIAFQAYMTTMYEGQKRAIADGEESSDNNLMTLLVRASQEAAKDGEVGGLTESEIYGNMFTFNFAGHDTTAHSSTFALYFLATNPEVQEWVSEEIQLVLGGREPHEIDHRVEFPRFKRCLVILYETLRLYTIVPAIKWTGEQATTLTVGDNTYDMPPKTIILPSYGSLHTDPKYWGPDSLEWRPSRWIRPGSGSTTVANESKLGNEEIDMNQRGVFLGWSEGARDCPGKKFSQVEFVALMVGLFRQWRVDPAVRKEEGETIEAARKRVMGLIREDSGWVLLLQMFHPERAPLVWRKV